ncbi:MAG: two-component regulator propeller domain-containing protein, partial [Bacteroidota bacterium]
MIQVFSNSYPFFYKYLLGFLLSQLMGSWMPTHSQSKYQFRHLDLQDGLLDNTVFSILQDQEGFLWFGTGSGLQRYDGYEFVNFKYDPKKNEQGLQNNMIRHLMEASDGTIWIGTEGGGVARYKDGKLLAPLLQDKDGLSSNSVETIIEDSLGGIWIGTSQGLDYLYEDKIIHFKNDPENKNTISDNRVFSLLID